MKRTLVFSAIIGSFALAMTAKADNAQQSTQQTPTVGIDERDFPNPDKDRPKKKRKFGQFGKVGQIIDRFKKEEKEEQTQPVVPIDPGIGNGQPTAPQVPTRPGYVWVGDHWERERAPMGNSVKPGFVWVGDHWERVRAEAKTTGPEIRDHRMPKTTGTPVIRDHRQQSSPDNYPGFGQGGSSVTGGPIIRDHRHPNASITGDSSRAPGGVTVTNSSRPPRRPASNGGAITSEDGLIDAIGGGLSDIGDALGDALGSAGNAVGIGHGSITPVGPSRPARPAYKAPAGATVRDHRN